MSYNFVIVDGVTNKKIDGSGFKCEFIPRIGEHLDHPEIRSYENKIIYKIEHVVSSYVVYGTSITTIRLYINPPNDYKGFDNFYNKEY